MLEKALIAHLASDFGFNPESIGMPLNVFFAAHPEDAQAFLTPILRERVAQFLMYDEHPIALRFRAEHARQFALPLDDAFIAALQYDVVTPYIEATVLTHLFGLNLDVHHLMSGFEPCLLNLATGAEFEAHTLNIFHYDALWQVGTPHMAGAGCLYQAFAQWLCAVVGALADEAALEADDEADNEEIMALIKFSELDIGDDTVAERPTNPIPHGESGASASRKRSAFSLDQAPEMDELTEIFCHYQPRLFSAVSPQEGRLSSLSSRSGSSASTRPGSTSSEEISRPLRRLRVESPK